MSEGGAAPSMEEAAKQWALYVASQGGPDVSGDPKAAMQQYMTMMQLYMASSQQQEIPQQPQQPRGEQRRDQRDEQRRDQRDSRDHDRDRDRDRERERERERRDIERDRDRDRRDRRDAAPPPPTAAVAAAQPPTTTASMDTVYVTGLPTTATEDAIAKLFGSIGIIRIDKKTRKPLIHLYRDKATNTLKGDGTVSYDDPEAATASVRWFNGKDFEGAKITVQLAEQKERPAGDYHQRHGPSSYGGSSGGGGSGSGMPRGGGGGTPGDWTCPACGNLNYARRTECNRCHAPKQGGGGGSSGGGGGGGGSYSQAPPQPRGQGAPREGDWTCPQCGGNNYSRRTECFRCNAPRSDGGSAGSGRYPPQQQQQQQQQRQYAPQQYAPPQQQMQQPPPPQYQPPQQQQYPPQPYYGGGGSGSDYRGGDNVDRRSDDRRSHRDHPY